MKKFLGFCLILPLFFVGVSSIRAQNDIITVAPEHNTSTPCGFIASISNHNAAGLNIDEVTFEITTGNGIVFDQLVLPSQWTLKNQTDLQLDATSDNGGIKPNGTLSGFILSYVDNSYNTPVTITWTTLSAGAVLSTGTLNTICTQYQSYTALDIVTVNTSQSGPDPCFTFTMKNNNDEGNQTHATIWNVAFQLENPTAGTLRPSKIVPADGWVLDSVTTYTAYFHTDNSPINPGAAVSGWQVCLRASPLATKYNFVWTASDNANALIDEDTLFNISNTAAVSNTDADSVSVKAVNGCLYDLTLKDFHVSSILPSRIVQLVLTSKTSGITFAAAPSAPTNWKKTISKAGDSIIYTSDSLFDGIPSGTVSSQFSFSVIGPTTTNFNIGWETDGAGSPFPPKVSTVSTGTLTLNCKVAVPATDSAFVSPGISACNYKLTVENVHNKPQQSNLAAITISIPANTGQITGTGATTSDWSFSNTSPTVIKYVSGVATSDMKTGDAQDLSFSFSPKTSGTDVSATWTTIDDQGTTTGTGNFTINCTQSVTVCDTFMQTGNLNSDSCVKTFTLTNRKTVDITQLAISTTNGWQIDTASTPAGWNKQVVGKSQVNFTNNGLKSGDVAIFDLKFIAYYPDTSHLPPPNTFAVIAVTTDVNLANCTSTDTVTPGCLAHSYHVVTGSVKPYSGDIGVTNFTIVPNPTRGSADIAFDLNTPERVVISVIDVLGNQITTLNSKLMNQGSYHIPYAMNGLPNGTYYIRMQTPLGVMTRKLILTR